ncbi:MAG TPA: flagellar biosynthesis anti-sigma factor FlgM [Variovorax sp.]|nr:flagellar biosynthesis anti-sigma factor FlgM [Variovorax sp.]
MKINPLNDAAQAAALGATRGERGATAAGSATTGPVSPVAATSGVPVTVSATARSLEGVSAGSGIDEAKVKAVKAAIADGSFQVNSGAIADKLLANAQEFFSHNRS